MTAQPLTVEVQRSATLTDACSRFLQDLGAWAHRCVDRYAVAPPTDVHDQLTYTTGWEPYLHVTRDARLLHFLDEAQRRVAAHFVATDQWYHGYWRMQEAHHGTEHFELFLGFLSRIMPNEMTTVQLIDAVEHLGNWNDDVVPWFDYETGLYRSLFFGTGGVQNDPAQLNMPDHLRCANLLLLAYEQTSVRAYLDLAARYGGLWADAVVRDPVHIPAGLTRDGILYALTDAGDASYHAFAGMAGELDTDLDRAENILASSGIQLFLQLWQNTREERFLAAVERLLDTLAPALTDPDAGALADSMRSYRRLTGRTRYDDAILAAVNGLAPDSVTTIRAELTAKRSRRPAGVGKRGDMPVWYEGDEPRRHSPILLAVAAEIDDDSAAAKEAVDLARTYFRLAVDSLVDGRDHGCAAQSISAIARGHGRENHAGMTTAVLGPVIEAFGVAQEG